MTRLGPTCTGCRVRSINYNAVTRGTHPHAPQSVQENDGNKILWDFNIKKNKVIEHRRPDTVFINKQRRESQINDFSIPGDQNVAKYQDVRTELQKVWNVNVVVMPVVIGTLGTKSKKMHHHYIKQIDMLTDIISIEKTAILGTACILRIAEEC